MICTDCGEECEMIEETFDYAPAHCTFGLAGTHKTGIYVTKCCGCDAIEGYDGWHIKYDPKPMPDRKHDFNYWHDDYDGAEDGNGLCGTAESVRHALAEISEIDIT